MHDIESADVVAKAARVDGEAEEVAALRQVRVDCSIFIYFHMCIYM